MATEAAMVTERKKKFDSARKAWEEKSSSGQVVTAAADADAQLFVAPAIVKGVVGGSQQFNAFDIEGKNVPADEWTISNPTSGELIRGTEPTVVFKKADVIAVRARAGAEIAQATITVSEKGPCPRFPDTGHGNLYRRSQRCMGRICIRWKRTKRETRSSGRCSRMDVNYG